MPYTAPTLLFGILLMCCGDLLVPMVASQPGPSSSGPHQQHPHHLQPATVFLPYCAYLASGLSPHDQAVLRSGVQQVLHLRKRVRDLQELISNNEVVPADPKVQAAFKTPKSVPELKADLAAAGSNLTQHTTEFDTVLTRMTASGRLPSNATFDYVSQCLSSRLDPQLFPYRPKVSFLLEYFKRPLVIERYVERLRKVATQQGIPCELVVNVDSITEHQQWAELAAANGSALGALLFSVVPVLSANIHETRAYNRLAALARGSILVFMQDDDIPPQDPAWVRNLVTVMEAYPQVAAVGMQSYRYCIHGFNNQYQGDFYFYDSRSLIRMQYAAAVDFAPMAVRRMAFEEVGGLDEGLSDAGQCGIYGDWELATRFWVAGWHVLYMDVSGREGDGQDGGTHKPETGGRCWQRQMHSASRTMHKRFDPLIPVICDLVRTLNLEKLQIIDKNKPCPFGHEKCALPQQAGGPAPQYHDLV